MKKRNLMRIVNKLLVICGAAAIMCVSVTGNVYANDKDTEVVIDQEPTAMNANITIDGYYDDWEDKPMSIITWNSNNGEAHHDVSFIKDDNFIYIYVNMHPMYNSTIPITAINLSVNGQLCQMFLGYANTQNTTDWNHKVNLIENGTYLDLHPFTYNPNYVLGDAAVTISNGKPNDTMEIRIKIHDLERAMNLKEGTINSGSKLELSLPNVGGGTIELVGTSSGGIVGILLCVGVVITVILYRRKKVRLTR